MAARRGKSQARRNQGPGIPGWAWLIAGLVLGIGLILVVPGFLGSDGEDGFFRPQPNPDAQPAASIGTVDDPAASTDEAAPEYDFYTLLPGEEVALTDAQLAATARAEAEREAADDADPEPADATQPDDAGADTTPAAADGARYILQAGSFSTPGDAETVKARIALLGLSARVEPAQIRGKTMYRVRMGPYGSASALAEAKRKLAAADLPALAIKAK